ncbi:hypothetical protein CFC21_081371 [Triticum aestivum]|uniref:DUF4220 domain-containing protein n=2 Tax=Triticum aestivum TaxID=4565 RepID=A0A3B6NIF3_WHEAT|nr:hypothetical protein CFC21_081371 [Triticum aestivum]
MVLMSLVSRAAVAMHNSSASAPAPAPGMCSTTDMALMWNRSMSDTQQSTTERLMVTTTALMTFLGIALFLLGVLGRFTGRHRGHSPVTCIFFRATFSLFLPFMSYAFSQAKTEAKTDPCNNYRAQLILLWMLLVELLRSKVSAMVAPAAGAFSRGVGRYSSLDAVEEAARLVWIGYLIFTYVHSPGIKSFFIILWIFGVAKMCKRAICIRCAQGSFDLARNAALVSGYMAQLVHEQRQLSHDDVAAAAALGANVMRTCNYVVMGEARLKREVTPHGFEICDQGVKNILTGDGDPNGEQRKKSKLVRVCNIWDLSESDPIFRYNESRRRKMEDICLALALFKLLRRKMERLDMAEANTPQARDLVLRGLLTLEGGHDESADAERAFQVVELELRFLDEYYQAVIPLALPRPGLFIANFAFSIVFILIYCVTVLLVTGHGDIFKVLGSLFRGLVGLSFNTAQYHHFKDKVGTIVDMVCDSSDLIVTFLLTLTLLSVEAYEFLQYLLSDWFIASLVCHYSRKQRAIRKQLVKGTLWVKYRSRPVIKVHQVTMLKLHQLHPHRVWVLISSMLKKRVVGLPDAIVTADAKLVIVKALKDVLAPSSDRRFSNGIAALRRHGFHHLEWACDNKMGGAAVIMVWHVATALFETRDRQKHPLPPYGQAALMLSRYCAYLVAYEPGLLPDDEAWTDKVYKDMVTELNNFFRSCSTTVRRREGLMNYSPAGEEEENSVIAKGVRLGKQLVDREQLEDGPSSSADGSMHKDEKVWGMLLEFWAELLVFVARRPMAGQEAHARALANGGEFITHIWTMLTHAGIRVPKRDREDQAHQV